MDFHKERCKKLKEIRKKIADTIGIDLHQTECTYEGECSGTCPRCQQEEQRLNQALLSKTALATGVLAMSVGLTGCDFGNQGQISGDVSSVAPTTEMELDGMTEMELSGEETYNPDFTEEDEQSCSVADTEIMELEGDVAYTLEEIVDTTEESTNDSSEDR